MGRVLVSFFKILNPYNFYLGSHTHMAAHQSELQVIPIPSCRSPSSPANASRLASMERMRARPKIIMHTFSLRLPEPAEQDNTPQYGVYDDYQPAGRDPELDTGVLLSALLSRQHRRSRRVFPQLRPTQAVSSFLIQSSFPQGNYSHLEPAPQCIIRPQYLRQATTML